MVKIEKITPIYENNMTGNEQIYVLNVVIHWWKLYNTQRIVKAKYSHMQEWR